MALEGHRALMQALVVLLPPIHLPLHLHHLPLDDLQTVP